MRKATGSVATSVSFAFVGGLFVPLAHAAPAANLPLTCSTASAIGQPQNNCGGDWAYLAPNTDQLIVLKGPSSAPTWARAASLASSDVLAVCSLPVEPGNYSSCKDSAGVRRIVYLAKSQVFGSSSPPPSGGTGGTSPRSIAVVAASGGHYTDPLAAVANVSQGDAWCRAAGDDPARFPCAISIAPGVYELASTLVVPAHVAVVGYGPGMTVLTARAGVGVTVQLGVAQPDPILGIALRDLTVENRSGAGGGSVALSIVEEASEVYNVRATAAGASENIGVRYDGVGRGSARNHLRRLEAVATGGSTSTGFKVVNRGGPQIEDCSISAADASTRNVGFETNGGATLERCQVVATGGATAVAMSVVGTTGFGPGGASSVVSDSELVAQGGFTETTGYFSRGTGGAIWKRVEVRVRSPGSGSATGISLSQSPPYGEGYFEHVNVDVAGGGTSVGMYLESGHHDPQSTLVTDSRFIVVGYGGAGYGIRLGPFAPESQRLHLFRSHVSGASAALFSDAPFQEWEGLGPPLTVRITDTVLYGGLDLNRHYLNCVAVMDVTRFYPETCPPGDWTPSPR